MFVMKMQSLFPLGLLRTATAIMCSLLLIGGDPALWAAPQEASGGQQSATLSNDQLDALVAPIALYPDPLLSQVLVASTYPLEIIQLQQWLDKNKGLKDKALADAAKKQDWDPSVQALAVLPDAAKLLAENIKWTTDLGNAFLAQQSAVMDAVQRMRTKAKDKGNLKSTEQQKVETKVVESKQVIVIEPSSPEVVYVPSYNPTVVYGPPVYAYPPVAYPPAGYYAAGMAISFGVGMMVGAAFGGGWGWGCGWGGNNNVYINHNNNFVQNSNRQNFQGGNRTNVSGGNKTNWQHNPEHRGGTPYGDRTTANKFGGTARGDSLQSRQSQARQNQTRQVSSMDRAAGGRQTDRGPSAGTMDRGGSRGSGVGGGGGDRVGNRSVSSSPSSHGNSAFGGGSGGFDGGSARASSSRGASSFGGGGRSSGGGSRGGGGGRRR